MDLFAKTCVLPLEFPFHNENFLHFLTFFNVGIPWGDCPPKAFSKDVANMHHHTTASESHGGRVSWLSFLNC